MRPRRPERGRGAFAMAAGMLATVRAGLRNHEVRAEVLVRNIGYERITADLP